MTFLSKLRIRKTIFNNKTILKPLDLNNEREINKNRLSMLASQEYKVFMLIREGYTKKDCCSRLDMNRREVNRSVGEVYYKLNVTNVSELIIKYKDIY